PQSKWYGQMRFVYASGSDLTDSSSARARGNRLTPHVAMTSARLAIDPHASRLCGVDGRCRATAMRSASDRAAISAPSSDAAQFLGREHQARGRTRPTPRLAALARARVDSRAA